MLTNQKNSKTSNKMVLYNKKQDFNSLFSEKNILVGLQKTFLFTLLISKSKKLHDGIVAREDFETLDDDYRGKLAEVGVVNRINIYNKGIAEQEKMIVDKRVDWSVMTQGHWDIADLKVNKKILNIKSSTPISKFLMMKVEDFEEGTDGQISYLNNDDKPVEFDAFVFVKTGLIKPYPKDDVKNSFNKSNFNNIINNPFKGYMEGKIKNFISNFKGPNGDDISDADSNHDGVLLTRNQFDQLFSYLNSYDDLKEEECSNCFLKNNYKAWNDIRELYRSLYKDFMNQFSLITCEVSGAITRDDFWNKKGFAEAGMPMHAADLKKAYESTRNFTERDLNNRAIKYHLEEGDEGYGKKWKYLQNSNYIYPADEMDDFINYLKRSR